MFMCNNTPSARKCKHKHKRKRKRMHNCHVSGRAFATIKNKTKQKSLAWAPSHNKHPSNRRCQLSTLLLTVDGNQTFAISYNGTALFFVCACSLSGLVSALPWTAVMAASFFKSAAASSHPSLPYLPGKENPPRDVPS